MAYFLTVRNHRGDYLHKGDRHDSLDDAIAFVAEHYLTEPDFPRYWTGKVAIRSGRISRVLMRKSAFTSQLRDNIDYVYICNDQALREIEEHDPDMTSKA